MNFDLHRNINEITAKIKIPMNHTFVTFISITIELIENTLDKNLNAHKLLKQKNSNS